MGAEASGEGARLEILNGYTEMGQGIFTATLQAVCEETGLSPDLMQVRWDKDLGEQVWRDVGLARHDLELRGGEDCGAEADDGSEEVAG